MSKLKYLFKNIRDYYAIKKSYLFNEHYYLDHNPDVRLADTNALKHFVKFGHKEQRNPSSDFDIEYYLRAYSDVCPEKVNPLLHYIKHGKKEGRVTNENMPIQSNSINIKSLFSKERNKSVTLKKEELYESYIKNNNSNKKNKLLIQKSIEINHSEKPKTYIDSFKIKIQNTDIISLDIFDTLIHRNVLNPTSIFSLIEIYLEKNHGIGIPFAKYRPEAELKARKELNKNEITLDDIYLKLKSILKLDSSLIEKIKFIEEELELSAIIPNKLFTELLETARKNNKKIVLISDMYLSKKTIIKFLVKSGIYIEDKDIYVSSEVQKTKNSGDMFDHVLGLYECSPDRWLHVGDNYNSDIVMADKKGIQTYYIKNHTELFNERNPHLLNLHHNNDNDINFKACFESIYGLISNRYYSNPESSNINHSAYNGDTYRLGFETLGPVFLGFLHFLFKTISSQNYDKVFFISRDGYYLKESYDKLRESIPSLPASSYFYSSRALSYSASLIDNESILQVANKDYFPTTLKHLLTYRFNFTEKMFDACYENLLKNNFKSFEDQVIQHKNHKQFISFVNSCSELIIKCNTQTNINFKEYIKKSGITKNSAIIDIGYAGSLQMTLQKIAGINVDGIYYIVNKNIDQLKNNKLNFYTYIDKLDKTNEVFFKNVQLFELFFSATHPSIVGISSEQEPLFDTQQFDSETNFTLAKLHHGAIDFVESYLGHHLLLFKSINKYDSNLTISNILNFFKSPDELDCINFSGIVFEDNFGANKFPLLTKNTHILGMDDSKVQQLGYWVAASRKLAQLNIAFASTHKKNITIEPTDEKILIPAYRKKDYQQKTNSSEKINFHFIIKVKDDAVEEILSQLKEQFYPYWTATFIVDNYQSQISAHPDNERVNFSQKNLSKELIESLESSYFVIIEDNISLEPDLLVEFSKKLAQSDYDMIYTDHDYQVKQERQSPEFKPDFSPELLLSQPYYLGDMVCINKTMILSNEFDCDSLIDALAFYAVYKNKSVNHISKILYHNLYSDKSIINHTSLIEDYLNKVDLEFESVFIQFKDNRKNIYSVKFKDYGPNVAIIIPTKNRFDLLKVALDSLKMTTYANYKIYIIDNESTDQDIIKFFAKTKHTILPIASPNGQFSYSYINNEAAKQVSEDYVLFLNNDIKVITKDWLSQMMGLIQIKGMGSIGAKLYYANNRLQHVGIINHVSSYGLPAPALKLIEGQANGYLNYAKSIKNFSAMTAACMLTPRHIFLDMGGFDDIHFSVAYNDCDYGFRLTQAGYRNAVATNAELYHFEGATRGIGVGNDKPSEEAAFIQQYKNWQDPFYNPNLTDEGTDFALGTKLYRTTPSQKFRCLFVSHNLNYEGAPLIIYEIAKGLKALGYIEPVILSPADGDLKSAYEELGIEVHILNTNIMNLFSAKSESIYQKTLLSISDFIGTLNINVIVANTILCHWAIESAHILALPSVWIIHESEPPFTHLREHSKLLEKHGQQSIHYPYRVVFVANSTKDLFKPFNLGNNFTTIYNGFDPERVNIQMTEKIRLETRQELGIDDKFVFICPGVVSKRKAQIDALKAFAALPDEYKAKAALLIVGDRESFYSTRLHIYHKQMNSSFKNNIKIINETKDIGKYYNAADAFLFTSHLESFPKVIQESMYLGLPIVSTNVFGISEQVHHMSSALLCNPGDIKSLSKNIEEIMTNTELREKLKTNAFSALDKLPSYDEMINEYNNILQESFLTHEE